MDPVGDGRRGRAVGELISRRLAIALTALAVLTAALLGLGLAGDPRLPDTPSAGVWQTADGSLPVTLTDTGVLTVRQGEATLFASEPGWRVCSFLTGDLDGDGSDELALLVWRQGFYGSSHPFWRQNDCTRYTQHIFLYRWQDGAVQPFWMSSGLDPEVASWSLTDTGDLAIRTPQGEDTRWGWRTWGLERLDVPPRRL